MDLEIRTCIKCREPKPIHNFHSNGRGGKRSECSICRSNMRRKKRRHIRGKNKKYQEEVKTCIDCKKIKPILSFNLKGPGRSRRGDCRVCSNKKRGRPEAVYKEYKRSAFRRGILFDISENEFRSYQGMSCNYCGEKLDRIRLDRVDSGKGYTGENLVSCCKTCNFLKGSLKADEFLRHVCKVYLYNKER